MNVGLEFFPKPVLFEGLLKDFPREVKQAAFIGIDAIATRSRSRIQSLTPGKKLPFGWVIRRRGNANFRFRRITNVDKRAYAPMLLKSGKVTNLMECLEYGTRPHEIVPVKAKFLRFVASDGKVVFTKLVRHPGTQAYGMIGITYAEAAKQVAVLQYSLAGMLKRGIKL